jgi:hypothetical protein
MLKLSYFSFSSSNFNFSSTSLYLVANGLRTIQLSVNLRIKISTTNNPHYPILKVSLVSPLAKKRCQSWTFSLQITKASCCCTPFLAGNNSLGVKTPSSSGHVFSTNGQTDRLLVPYRGQQEHNNII